MSKPIIRHLQVTLHPETREMSALVTLELERQLICHTLPLADALKCLQQELEHILDADQRLQKPSTHL